MGVVNDVAELKRRALDLRVDPNSPELRELVALAIEIQFHDYLDAWEVRHDRPWYEMTAAEAAELVLRSPKLVHNASIESLAQSRK